MNQDIAIELQFFAFCILWGGLVLFAYDILRIFRRLIKHGTFPLAIEDLIFWMITGIFLYAMIYRQNNGIIRGFAIMGMTVGMLLYHLLIKDNFVKMVVKSIHILLKPFVVVAGLIKKVFTFVNKKVHKVMKVLLRQLKLVNKSIKMNLSKKLQKRNHKRQEKHLKRRERLEKKAATRKKNVKNTRKAQSAKNRRNGIEPSSRNKDDSLQQLRVHGPEPTFQRISEEELKQWLSKNRR